jgi:WD40 repeat protein
MSNDQIMRSACTLTDHEVLVTGDDIDSENFYGLVDTRRAEFRWRNTGRIRSSARLDSNHVVVGHEGGVELVRIATGQRVAGWRCPRFDESLALPDGNLATRSGHVICVWDVAEASKRTQLVYPPQNSFISAAFSPDGRRLFTGETLCDRETGRFIANLDCTGPGGWLEGGPPPDCQRLCNGVFVQVTPFGLTAWDSRDGRVLVPRDGDRRARPSDLVAFDPMGQYHAIWSERGTLHVFRLRQGTVIRELQQPMPKDAPKLGFSADGSLLAWVNARGERWAIRVADPGALYPIAHDEDPWEPAAKTLEIVDGVLVADGAAIPFDDRTATVRDKDFAGSHSHVRLA